MCVAPATMAWTRVKILRPGWNPPLRAPRRMVVLHKSSRPSLRTKVATSNRPALATRFGSSKVTAIRSIPRDTGFTESASLGWVKRRRRASHFPIGEAFSADTRAINQLSRRCIEAKSVSVLWGLSDSETSAAVRAAHDRAVAEGLEYLERHATMARRGAGGERRIETSGLVAAAFVHRTSRNG